MAGTDPAARSLIPSSTARGQTRFRPPRRARLLWLARIRSVNPPASLRPSRSSRRFPSDAVDTGVLISGGRRGRGPGRLIGRREVGTATEVLWRNV